MHQMGYYKLVGSEGEQITCNPQIEFGFWKGWQQNEEEMLSQHYEMLPCAKISQDQQIPNMCQSWWAIGTSRYLLGRWQEKTQGTHLRQVKTTSTSAGRLNPTQVNATAMKSSAHPQPASQKGFPQLPAPEQHPAPHAGAPGFNRNRIYDAFPFDVVMRSWSHLMAFWFSLSFLLFFFFLPSPPLLSKHGAQLQPIVECRHLQCSQPQ